MCVCVVYVYIFSAAILDIVHRMITHILGMLPISAILDILGCPC